MNAANHEAATAASEDMVKVIRLHAGAVLPDGRTSVSFVWPWDGPATIGEAYWLSTLPTPTPAPAVPEEWRCPECGCHSFARIAEQKPDRSFGPGPKIRCVNCKETFASPPAQAEDAGLREACKPWEFHIGEPPDDESPLSGVFGAGITYTEQHLAELLGVAEFERGDGSEDFRTDAGNTLLNILAAAGLYDRDEGQFAALSRPQAQAQVAASEAHHISGYTQGIVDPEDHHNYVAAQVAADPVGASVNHNRERDDVRAAEDAAHAAGEATSKKHAEMNGLLDAQGKLGFTREYTAMAVVQDALKAYHTTLATRTAPLAPAASAGREGAEAMRLACLRIIEHPKAGLVPPDGGDPTPAEMLANIAADIRALAPAASPVRCSICGEHDGVGEECACVRSDTLYFPKGGAPQPAQAPAASAGREGAPGFVLVPREPTPEQFGAGGVAQFKNAMACTPVREAVGNVYRAMVERAALAPAASAGREGASEAFETAGGAATSSAQDGAALACGTAKGSTANERAPSAQLDNKRERIAQIIEPEVDVRWRARFEYQRAVLLQNEADATRVANFHFPEWPTALVKAEAALAPAAPRDPAERETIARIIKKTVKAYWDGGPVILFHDDTVAEAADAILDARPGAAGVAGDHKIIEAADLLRPGWALTIEWPDGTETVEHVSDNAARVLGYRSEDAGGENHDPTPASSAESDGGSV